MPSGEWSPGVGGRTQGGSGEMPVAGIKERGLTLDSLAPRGKTAVKRTLRTLGWGTSGKLSPVPRGGRPRKKQVWAGWK